jgi:hypothetical protein
LQIAAGIFLCEIFFHFGAVAFIENRDRRDARRIIRPQKVENRDKIVRLPPSEFTHIHVLPIDEAVLDSLRDFDRVDGFRQVPFEVEDKMPFDGKSFGERREERQQQIAFSRVQFVFFVEPLGEIRDRRFAVQGLDRFKFAECFLIRVENDGSSILEVGDDQISHGSLLR